MRTGNLHFGFFCDSGMLSYFKQAQFPQPVRFGRVLQPLTIPEHRPLGSCSPIISSLLYLQQQSPALCRWMPNRRADLAEMLLPALSGGCSPAHGVLSLEGPGAIKILSGTAAVQPPVKCNLNHWMLKLCCSSGLEN